MNMNTIIIVDKHGSLKVFNRADIEGILARIEELETENESLRANAEIMDAILYYVNAGHRFVFEKWDDDNGQYVISVPRLGGKRFYEGKTPRAVMETAGLLETRLE